MVAIREYLHEADWRIVHEHHFEGREGRYAPTHDLSVSAALNKYLSSFKGGVYVHQKEALRRVLNKKNVCISTGTGSGKSAVFYAAAIEQIARERQARILAIYPLKALGNEQRAKWECALHDSGLESVKAGRIDGSVPQGERLAVLEESQVIVATPGIVHAWLLNNLSSRVVTDFIRHLRLVVVDEAHVYTGVFGSNCAYLFRRLNHAVSILNDTLPVYVSASATIKNARLHTEQLVGVPFEVIGNELDSSPKKSLDVLMIEPPGTRDLLTTISDLMRFIATRTQHKFITFVDSRKQTEYLTSILARYGENDEENEFRYDHLEKLQILPYRAGYEEVDRDRIQRRLTNGQLSGVVSTSALELGIDIPSLTLAILLGVPASATSFYQRLGRIARHKDGLALIVNDGTVFTKRIFRDPNRLLEIPLSESSLYLENPRIQYIHALCLARQGGEHDSVLSRLGLEDEGFSSKVNFSPEFIKLCISERIGEIPAELQSMKGQAGDDPNHTYPLRDIDVQYQVEYQNGPDRRRLGSLSHDQLLREAYPGAVYYYQTQAYRVFRVNSASKRVDVRHEKKYTTKPAVLPKMIFPNLSSDSVSRNVRRGELIITECNLQIRESISGYKERRGPNELVINYPLDPTKALFFDLERFTRNYFTTGIILTHPVLNEVNVRCALLAELLYEAFIMTIAFERQDISFGNDKHRADRGLFRQKDKFVSIFDKTYGSLRLTSRLMEDEVITKVFDTALEVCHNEESLDINRETVEAIEVLRNCLDDIGMEELVAVTSDTSVVPPNTERVIMPNSKGLNVAQDNQEFFVERVFYSPVLKCLAYRGKHLSQQGQAFESVEISVPVRNIIEIPGESVLGIYDYETGEVKEIG